ncbi:MAG: hypothetical protein ACFE8A_09685 [Candidatus Hodarchaeota archaeon]
MKRISVKHEDIVFEVIKDYLNKNRVFEIKKIISYINSRFAKSSININNEGITKIIISLAKKKMIAEGSKLTRKDVLNYSRRKKIYNYIKENPGQYLNNIAKDLNISNVVVFWHLSVLVKFDFIKKTIIDNHVLYFDSNIDIRDISRYYLTSKEKIKKIINYLKFNDFGITKTKLSKDLKIHHYTIEKYVNSLEDCDIISKENKSNKILYFLKEKQTT